MIHLKNSIKPSVGLETCKIIRNSICVNDVVKNSSTQNPMNHPQYEPNFVQESLRKSAVTFRSTNLKEKRSLKYILNLKYRFSEAKE